MIEKRRYPTDYPDPPIERMAGHLPGCYDSCGNWRSCESKCPAHARWMQGGPERDAAMAAWERDMGRGDE